MKIYRYLPLTVLPLLLLILGLYLQDALGPHFLGSSLDPDYAYLFNSLAITQSKPIGHTDHPGTPVQSLGALVITVSSFLRNKPDVQRDVLENPELYINFFLKTILAINTLALLAIGLITYLITKKIWISLFIQLTPFLSMTTLYSPLLRFSPEPILLLSGLVFAQLIFIILFRPRFRGRWAMLMFSLTSGLGIATKIIFFPLVFIPLAILPSIKHRIGYILGTTVSFYFFTQLIVDKYPQLFSWINSLFTHSGRYGTGEASVIDKATYLPNMMSLLSGELTLVASLALSILILIIYSIRKGAIHLFCTNLPFRLLLGIAIAQFLQIIMVAKHPGGHYLIPAMLLTATNFFTITYVLTNSRAYRFLSPKNKLLVVVLSGILLALPLFSTLSRAISLHEALINERGKQIAAYEEIQRKYKDALIITYFRSSSPTYAMKFGNLFSSNNFTNYLKVIYPDAYSWDIWNASFGNWDSVTDFKTILENRRGRDIILYGTSFEGYYKDSPNYKPNLPLIDLYHGQNETIYKVDLSRLK